MSARPDPASASPGPEAVPGPVWLAPPQLPHWPIVWLVLESDPEGGPMDCALHSCGLAVDDGGSEIVPEAITADFEEPGGRRVWERFVARASEILDRYPEARWVHYSSDERASVQACAAAYGTPAGFFERLEEALFELLSRGVRRAVRLPLDTRTIRQVAALAGFRWRDPPPGPAGSMGRYRRAMASADPIDRAHVLREIADANAEDLMAMRAVWRWMIEQGPREYCG